MLFIVELCYYITCCYFNIILHPSGMERYVDISEHCMAVYMLCSTVRYVLFAVYSIVIWPTCGTVGLCSPHVGAFHQKYMLAVTCTCDRRL